MSFKHKLKINEKRYAIQILSIKIISICLQPEYFITCTYPITVYSFFFFQTHPPALLFIIYQLFIHPDLFGVIFLFLMFGFHLTLDIYFSSKSLIWLLPPAPPTVWLMKCLIKGSLSGFAGLPYLHSKNSSLWSSY